MSLEIPTHEKREKIPLTPEAIEALGKGYEMEVEHLREENIAFLEKASQIAPPEDRKKIIMRLGWISIKATEANEKLLEELRKQSKLRKQNKLN